MPLGDLEERYQNYYGGPMEMPDSYVAYATAAGDEAVEKQGRVPRVRHSC